MEKRDMKIMNIVCDRICGRTDHCMSQEEVEDMCDTCPLVQFFEDEELLDILKGGEECDL